MENRDPLPPCQLLRPARQRPRGRAADKWSATALFMDTAITTNSYSESSQIGARERDKRKTTAFAAYTARRRGCSAEARSPAQCRHLR